MIQKRNIRYSETSLSSILSDILVTLFCVFLSGYSLFLFTQELNRTLSKNNEQPIATITYKRKSAQRKFSDRAVWDRLKQESSIYNKDTIRTASLSEATVWFSDGSTMQLDENTLAVIYSKENKNGVSLKKGNLSISSSGKEMLFDSGTATVTVSADTEISASNTKTKGLRLQVDKGNAAYVQDGKKENLKEGTVSVNGKIPLISVLSPKPEEMILNQEGKSLSIPFKWKSPELSKNDYLILEISSSKDFKNSTQQVISEKNKKILNLVSGNWYWRIYSKNEGIKSQDTVLGKIKILDAPSPLEIAPVKGFQYKYRTQKPVIHFLWTGNSYAASYILEIADNQEMKNPVVKKSTTTESSLVNDLAVGTWYWRVIPQYIISKITNGNPSAVSSFVIKKKNVFTAPFLQVPSENSIVNTSSGKNAMFSWEDDNEAFSYTIKIGSSKNLARPLIEKTTLENYFKVSNPRSIFTNGTWYWNVYKTDNEGNISPVSETQSFLAMDNNVIFKTLFPTNNYNLAVNRCFDTKFSWKSNLPFDSVLQISKKKDFSEVQYSFPVSGSDKNDIELSEGTWYWRLNVDSESFSKKTDPKKLHILPMLSKPVITEPVPGNNIIVRPESTVHYEWKPVHGADYYQFRLYKKSINTTPVYENVQIINPYVTLDMNDLEENSYIVSIQAFSYEKVNTSRRTGIPGTYTFRVRKVYPVTLSTPVENSVIPGETALLHPIIFKWKSKETPYYTRLILTKNGKKIVNLKNPRYDQKIQLREVGKYKWTVNAQTFDDNDMSAMNYGSFTVSPVPPLSSPKIESPDQILDFDYFIQQKAINFKWEPVEDANAYLIKILDSKKHLVYTTEIKVPVSANGQQSICSTCYKFDKLKLLKKGTMYWTLTAEMYIKDNLLFRESKEIEQKIDIELPDIKIPKSKNKGILYGK